MSIAFKEGLRIPPQAMEQIILGANQDVRQVSKKHNVYRSVSLFHGQPLSLLSSQCRQRSLTALPTESLVTNFPHETTDFYFLLETVLGVMIASSLVAIQSACKLCFHCRRFLVSFMPYVRKPCTLLSDRPVLYFLHIVVSRIIRPLFIAVVLFQLVLVKLFQVLHNMSMWTAKEKSLNYDQAKADAAKAQKDIKMV